MGDRENCRYLYSEPYYTPNNYDLYFNPQEVPLNIVQENIPNLQNRLQKTMPLSKIIHVNLNGVTEDNVSEVNSFKLTTHLTLNKRGIDFK